MTLISPPFNGDLPRAWGHCSCSCHRMPGVHHIMPCCFPSLDNAEDIIPTFKPLPEVVPMKEAADLYAENLKNVFIETVSGSKFYFDTSPFDVNDMAAALSKVCRYNGHCRVTYTVAQHEMLVADIMQILHLGDPFEGLMHDGHEYIFIDLPSPWKVLLPEYKVLEKRIERRMRNQFNLPEEITEGCKKADWLALFIEAEHLMVTRGKDWVAPEGIKDAAKDLVASHPMICRHLQLTPQHVIEREFLASYNALGPQFVVEQ